MSQLRLAAEAQYSRTLPPGWGWGVPNVSESTGSFAGGLPALVLGMGIAMDIDLCPLSFATRCVTGIVQSKEAAPRNERRSRSVGVRATRDRTPTPTFSFRAAHPDAASVL